MFLFWTDYLYVMFCHLLWISLLMLLEVYQSRWRTPLTTLFNSVWKKKWAENCTCKQYIHLIIDFQTSFVPFFNSSNHVPLFHKDTTPTSSALLIEIALQCHCHVSLHYFSTISPLFIISVLNEPRWCVGLSVHIAVDEHTQQGKLIDFWILRVIDRHPSSRILPLSPGYSKQSWLKRYLLGLILCHSTIITSPSNHYPPLTTS